MNEVTFVPSRYLERIFSNGKQIFVDIRADEKVDFTYPDLRRVKKAPRGNVLKLNGGVQYVFSGSVDVLGGSKVSAVVTYFEADRRLGHESIVLTSGNFSLEAHPPPDAQSAVLGFRIRGPACFEVHNVALTEIPPVDLGDEAKTVVMIVLNEILHDGRVLKTAQTLMRGGYHVLLFGMSRSRNSALTVTNIVGAKALIFPNPNSFLRNARVRALNWEHMVACMRASMWNYVERAGPRFIHTHDFHSLPLGFEFARRLRKAGVEVHWLHDFHEYVAGIDYMDPDIQAAAMEHEARAISLMDHRFTVSPVISDWLKDRYGLREGPTVVLNAPPASAIGVERERERSVRSDLGLDSTTDLIVFAGGVSEVRSIHTVVSALADHPGWHFALITNNTGEYVERLKQIAATKGYADRLHFLPYVQPHQITAYVSDASVGVIPYPRSGNSNAAMPNKLFEYLQAGLPIVASNMDLIQQFLKQWQIGEVFQEHNVQDCAETIGRVLSRQEFYRNNIRSNEELRREATWDSQSKKILDAYRGLEQVPAAPSVDTKP